MRARYLDLLERAERDPSVEAVVLCGAGGAFSAGADYHELDGLNSAVLKERYRAQRQPFDFAMTMHKPLIAAIEGAVAGIGYVHALMADYRFASETAFFTTAFSRIGLTAEGGIAWLLVRLVGTARALDLLQSSRRVGSEEAHRIGLVQWVVPPGGALAAARSYAKTLIEETSAYSRDRVREQVYGAWSQDCRTAYECSRQLVDESLDRSVVAEASCSSATLTRLTFQDRTSSNCVSAWTKNSSGRLSVSETMVVARSSSLPSMNGGR